MLHLTNGDSAVYGIEATGVGGEVVPWRDALHEGPLPAGVDPDELRAIRARFLAEQGWGDAEAIETGMRARDDRLDAARRTGEPIVLWFEHDLYDQLQLLQVLDAVDGAAAVEAILPDRFLGAMQPAELAALWDERAPLRRDQVALAHFAWEAVRAPDPTAIAALLDTHTGALPHLGPALRRLLEELPAVGDGLSRTERQALAAIAAGARTPHEVFAAAQGAEEAAFLGDTWMWARLHELGQGERRLVQTRAGEPVGPPPPMPGSDGFTAQELELTADGRAGPPGQADPPPRRRPRGPRRRGRPRRARAARPLGRRHPRQGPGARVALRPRARARGRRMSSAPMSAPSTALTPITRISDEFRVTTRKSTGTCVSFEMPNARSRKATAMEAIDFETNARSLRAGLSRGVVVGERVGSTSAIAHGA